MILYKVFMVAFSALQERLDLRTLHRRDFFLLDFRQLAASGGVALQLSSSDSLLQCLMQYTVNVPDGFCRQGLFVGSRVKQSVVELLDDGLRQVFESVAPQLRQDVKRNVASVSVMSSTRRTGTPARYISMSASSTLLSLRR